MQVLRRASSTGPLLPVSGAPADVRVLQRSGSGGSSSYSPKASLAARKRRKRAATALLLLALVLVGLLLRPYATESTLRSGVHDARFAWTHRALLPPVATQELVDSPHGSASSSSAERSAFVTSMTAHAWLGYSAHAWGKDELHPISKSGSDWLHLGLTIVDSLDTLLLAGLTEQYAAAREWVVAHLEFETDQGVSVNVFETTIRVLGGLLSAHHLTPGGDPQLLAKAVSLAPRLAAACGVTASGVPLSDINLATKAAKAPAWSADASVSEAATLVLEFTAVAAAAGAHPSAQLLSVAAAGLRAQAAVMTAAAGHNGLVTAKFISTSTGKFTGGSVVTLGARVDSYYEYLLKAWLHSGKLATDPRLRAYQDAVHAITTQLLVRSPTHDFVYVAELDNGRLIAKMDHLVCFYPGLLALGHAHGVRPRPEHAESEQLALAALGLGDSATQLDAARAITAACRAMYTASPTHLGPEIAYYEGDEGIQIHKGDGHSLLRPEYVESLFILWRVTGEQQYRDWGWELAQAIETHARVPSGGYASIENVMAQPDSVVQRDHMESFFVAETLKYLGMLFDDRADTVNLSEWVLNTEAHPLPIMKKASS